MPRPGAAPERVEAQAHVAPDYAAAVIFDRAGLVTQVAIEELAKRPLADEADAGGVFLLRVGQAGSRPRARARAVFLSSPTGNSVRDSCD